MLGGWARLILLLTNLTLPGPPRTGTVAVAVEACAKWEGDSVVELAVELDVELEVELEVGTLSVHKKKGGEKGTAVAIMNCHSNFLFGTKLVKD